MSTRLEVTDTVALNAGRPRRVLAALGLLGLLAGVPVFLSAIAGPPRLPSHLPSWVELEVVLRGPELPLGAVAYLAAMAAWLTWGYLALSIGLQIAALVAETVSSGQWVRALRRVADRLTAPMVRQLVEALFVALVVVHLAGRAPIVSAASASPVAAAVVAPSSAPAAQMAEPEQQPTSDAITYTVQSGDTLSKIAKEMLGDANAYMEIFNANRDQLSDPNKIKPGQVLKIPQHAAR